MRSVLEDRGMGLSGKTLRKDKYFKETEYEPHAGQEEVHYAGNPGVRHRVLSNGRRWGKGATLTTPVPTPNGWTTVGELDEDDEVFGADGSIIRILVAVEPYEADIWRITFDDGSTVEVDGPHRWVVWGRQARTRGAAPHIMTTDEIRERGRDDLSIPVAKPLQLKEAMLPLDPYLLGRWLGDGSSHHARVTSLPDDAEPLLERGGILWAGTAGRARHYGLPIGSRRILIDLDLLRNKHIPREYLRASEYQRRELLAGLIDSDGARENNRIRFSQSDRRVFMQVVELVTSLGYKVKISSRIAKLNGVEKKRSWRLTFVPDAGDYVAEVDRKKPIAARRRGVARHHRRIRSIEATGRRELVRCFTVSSDDHQWLIGEAMIPTHNTLLGGKEAEVTAWVMNRVGSAQRGWIVGPNYTDAEKEFRVIYNSLRQLGVEQMSDKFVNNPDSGSMHIRTKWGWDLQCRSAKHPETLVGEGLDFVILAEAGRLKRIVFTQFIRPALSDHRGWSLTTGVPEIATDISLLYWMYKRGLDGSKKSYRSWKMPSWTNPIVFPGGRQDEEILEAEDDLTTDEFDRQYGGEFVEKTGRVMKEWDDEIHIQNLVYNPKWPLYAACDYGYTNPFVWLWIQLDEFNNVYILGEHYIRHQDVEEIARRTLLQHPLVSKLIAFYPDPAEPDDTKIISRLLRKPGRSKGVGGPRKTRDAMIRKALKLYPEKAAPDDQRPGLYVDRSCEQFAWEMREGYRWPTHKSEVRNDSEMPLDKDNHGPEALGRFFGGYFDQRGGQQRTKISRVRIKA